jgi:hypothetical protein
MKKKKTNFESRFWSGRSKHSPIPLLELFFQFHDLATAKERLNLIMQYAVQGKTRIPEESSVVFHFLQSLRSFLRAGWYLRKKSGKWAARSGRDRFRKEYRDPVLVFCKAFKEYRPEEWRTSFWTSCISHPVRSIMCLSAISYARTSI